MIKRFKRIPTHMERCVRLEDDNDGSGIVIIGIVRVPGDIGNW